MAEATRARLWVGRGTFVALAIALVFVQLLPRETLPPEIVTPGVFLTALLAGEELPRILAPPDVFLVLVLVWVTRRPDYAPALLVGALMLFTDLLFQRPPGLWAALVLILTEMLRARSVALRTLPFFVEWASVTLGIIAITLANRIVLVLTVTPQAGLNLTLSQMVATCIVYPLIAALAHFIFGVSRPAPGEVDASGQRL